VLANLAGSPPISAKLALFPGLCEAAVKQVNGPASVAVLTLLGNLTAVELNKMKLGMTPGLFSALEQAAQSKGEARGRAQYILDQLQQQRALAQLQVAVPAMPVMGGGAPESQAMHAQMMMMQQQMQQQQMAHQQQMMMMMAMQQPQQQQVMVVNQKEDTSCLTKLFGCFVCIEFCRCVCCC